MMLDTNVDQIPTPPTRAITPLASFVMTNANTGETVFLPPLRTLFSPVAISNIEHSAECSRVVYDGQKMTTLFNVGGLALSLHGFGNLQSKLFKIQFLNDFW